MLTFALDFKTKGIMKKIQALNASEILVVRHLANRSKMDCWLCVENDGTIRDLENNGKKISIKEAITDMVEGLTPYDVEILTPNEVVTFVSLVSKLN